MATLNSNRNLCEKILSDTFGNEVLQKFAIEVLYSIKPESLELQIEILRQAMFDLSALSRTGGLAKLLEVQDLAAKVKLLSDAGLDILVRIKRMIDKNS